MYEICSLKLEKEKRPRVFEEGGSFDKSQACSLPQEYNKKVSGVCQVNHCPCSYICPTVLQPLLVSFETGRHCIQICFHQSYWREVDRGGAAVERRVEGEGGVISSVYGVVSRRHPVAPAWPGLTSPHIRTVLQSEGKQTRRWGCVVGEEEVGSAILPCSAVRVKAPPLLCALLFRTSTDEAESIVRKNKKVGRYYGDCVAGLLWAELGDRLGLQLPGGAPLGRPPEAPLSRPSEFSSISWIRGGMEPGISIFRVMTRSAPLALMLLRSVIFISILGNMCGLWGLLLLT